MDSSQIDVIHHKLRMGIFTDTKYIYIAGGGNGGMLAILKSEQIQPLLHVPCVVMLTTRS